MTNGFELIKANVENSVTAFNSDFEKYLAELNLPVEGVVVSNEERMVILQNVPSAISKLSIESKNKSMYVSKFIAACGAGLFDAALNFLWNEIVVNLRKKVIQFDFNYFIDSIINDSKRKSSFKNEEDITKLDDWELVRGCKDTGIITDIGYRHLDYIRDMRNHTSAAHPNHNDIDGLQLVSWLQTCIKEVFSKEPEGPVVEIKRLLNNLRNHQVSKTDIPSIKMNIERLSVDMVDSCIRAVFGMYSDPTTSSATRNNLKLIVDILWSNCSEEEKNNIGIKYAIFAGNAEIDRKELTNEFLTLVNGLSYLPEGEKEIKIGSAVDDLYRAHQGMNNFYNEPAFARILTSYIGEDGIVPHNITYKYVKVVVMCFIGNGYGVSSAAEDYYDTMISKFNDNHVKVFTLLFEDSSFNSRLQFGQCLSRVKYLVNKFVPITAHVKLKETLEYMQGLSDQQLRNVYNASEFKRLVANLK